MPSLLFFLIEFISIIIACLITFYLTTRTAFLDRFIKKTKYYNNTRLNTLTRKLIHEIRNPLNSVSLNLQLLEENLSKLDTEYKHNQRETINFDKDKAIVQVERISREVDRLNRILKDFSRYAKLPELEFQDTNLEKLIEEVINFIEPETERQNIKLVRNIESLPIVKIDPAQIKQTLFNLIINANQAMLEGGKLTISARLDGNNVIIEIEDTGHGIPTEIQEEIFDLFVSTKKEGTGIGLAIAKQVVESHGGKIEIKSKVGEGTKFTIFLPLLR